MRAIYCKSCVLPNRYTTSMRSPRPVLGKEIPRVNSWDKVFPVSNYSQFNHFKFTTMSTTNARVLNLDSVKNIMNSRDNITLDMVGRHVQFTVQGNGVILDVKDGDGNLVESKSEPGTVLQKKIYNVQAISAVAMGNERNRQYFTDAVAAEQAGDAAGASELFNKFLNATQISFNVLDNQRAFNTLYPGALIMAKVIRIDTENGSLLTLDASTISVQAPVVADKYKFDVSDFMAPAAEGTKAAPVKDALKGAAAKPAAAPAKAGATRKAVKA